MRDTNSHNFPIITLWNVTKSKSTSFAACYERRTRPAGTQDECYSVAHQMSPCSSVVKAPDRGAEGHGFNSSQGLSYILCSTIGLPSSVCVVCSAFVMAVKLAKLKDC